MTRRGPERDPLARFLLGAGLGSIAGGITYAIPAASAWWWAVALFVALLVWFGEPVVEFFTGD